MSGAVIRLTSAHTVTGELDVPGDKAISHRALLIGAGCEGSIAISGLSTARDVASSARAVAHLAADRPTGVPESLLEGLEPSSDPPTSLILEGRAGWSDWPSRGAIDCENSGTTLRLLAGILSGRSGEVTLTGDDSLSRRPMLRVAEPLRLMGARIDLGTANTPPLRIQGGGLVGIRYELPVASAQVKSAVLLAGLQASGNTTVVEPVPTRDHTERLLRFLGVPISDAPAITVEATQLFGDKEINIPGDFSSASFLLTAAAMHPEGDVTVTGVGLNPTRTAFLDVLRRFGAHVETGRVEEVSGEPRGSVRVRAGDRRPPWITPEEIPSCIDELPLVAVLAAVAEGETEIRGAAELRVKESDRIQTIAEGLNRMGADVRPLADGFAVKGGELSGGIVESFGDHRVAMTLAVAALVAKGETIIEGWDAVAVSYPEFERDLRLLTT